MILTWNKYFMGVAKLSALRSKDPSTQVGACIANKYKRIVALGYNGMPNGDDSFPWKREGKDPKKTKYAYVVHAEANAIVNATTELEGCTIYVSLFPCNECAKLIIQSRIKEVVYSSDKHAKSDSFRIARKMFQATGVKLTQIDEVNVTIS